MMTTYVCDYSLKFRSYAQLMRAYFQPNEFNESTDPDPDGVEDLEGDMMSSDSELMPDFDQVPEVTGYESDMSNEDPEDMNGLESKDQDDDSPPADETASAQRPDLEEGSDETSETKNVLRWK